MTLVLLVDTLRTGSLALLLTLLRASVEAAIVAGVVWGLCRAVPTLPAAVRTWLWWLVSLKLVLGLMPVPAVPLPWLPQSMATWTAPRTESAPPASLPRALPRTTAPRASTLVLPAPRETAPGQHPVHLVLARPAGARLAGCRRVAGLAPLARPRQCPAPAPTRRTGACPRRVACRATGARLRASGDAEGPCLTTHGRAAHHGHDATRDRVAGFQSRLPVADRTRPRSRS